MPAREIAVRLLWMLPAFTLLVGCVSGAPAGAPPQSLAPTDEATGCQLQALDESPDGSWQLLTAAGGTAGETGTWLVTADSMTRLVDIVPSSLSWEWAADSSLLWLTFNVPEYSTSPMGCFVMAVELGPTVTLVDQEAFSRDYAEPLYQPNYALAFAPVEKQLVTTARDEYFDEPDDRFFTFDASVAPPNWVSTDGPVPGLMGVVQNEATDDFLLVIVGQDGLELQRLDGATLLQALMSILAPLYPDISDQLLSGEIGLEGFVPRDSYALSADGQRMAIGYGEVNGVVVFDCAVGE